MNIKTKYGILPFILIAIVMGIICSLFFPVWAVRIFETFNSVFSNFLSLFIPLLIIGLVAPSIADLGKGAGKLLLITVAIAYFSTVFTGCISYFACRWTFPAILGNSLGTLDDAMEAVEDIYTPFFTIEMPAFINVTSALVMAFILGLGCTSIKGKSLKLVMEDFRDIITVTIKKVIIPLLPVFIFGIFLKMGAEGTVFSVMSIFIKIIAVIIVLHISVLVGQFLIAGAIAHKKPMTSLFKMLPAYVTALGTQSSAATIPVTLECTKKLGVRKDVADFTVPLCATIHMPCSILKIVATTIAISLAMDMPVNFSLYLKFILMLSITMVAAPGVPGGAIMAALGVIASTLGFSNEMQGLVIAIYIAIDCFGTAGNVTGDGAIAMIIDKIKSHGIEKKSPVHTRDGRR